MSEPAVLTIGHSIHPIGHFLDLLGTHGVAAVVDVRSAPYSRRQPGFGRESLQRTLEDRGMSYRFLGRELGARSQDRSCYQEGRVQYRRLARTPLFRAGLDRVVEEAKSRRVSLLCAEKEPLRCHRTFLVGRALEARGIPVTHIHADGHLEPQAEALTRLLALLGMDAPDLFATREQRIQEACARQEARIAYVDPELRPRADGPG